MGSPPPMRGKGNHHTFANRHLSGSPPPMRGKVCPPVADMWKRRITPAYAGKSVELLNEAKEC